MASVHKKTAKHYLTAFIVIAAGVILDQWSKYMAVLHLQGTDGVDLIPGVFRLTYLENRGAALSRQSYLWRYSLSTGACPPGGNSFPCVSVRYSSSPGRWAISSTG